MDNQEKENKQGYRITDNYSFGSLRTIFGNRCIDYYTQTQCDCNSKKE